MKNRINLKSTMLLGLLLTTLMLPLATVSAATSTDQPSQVQTTLRTDGDWTYIQNDMITIAFPAGGKKPMFLWWYTNDPNNINVVKYKGLIEYMTFDQPYYMTRAQAEGWRMREILQEHFYMPIHGMMGEHMRQNIESILGDIEDYPNLHRPFLPFSGAKWELSTPTNVTQGDVKYLGFNFTLVNIPDNWPNLQFAEGNIIIRCRFYYTPATIDVEGKYSYTVQAGEFKMDLVVKHWEWNIDKLQPLLNQLENQLNITIPETKSGLALWVNLASINMTKLPIVEDDGQGLNDNGVEEAAQSMTNNMNTYMYVEGQETPIAQNRTGLEDEHQLPGLVRERYQFRFEQGNATFAGFFKFVPQALIRDPNSQAILSTVDVTASYISGGAHMRVYIGYPYFGNMTLEHDPSIGLEIVPAFITWPLILALLSAVSIIAVAILAIRQKKGPINMLKPN
jgi:hypothetical protein